MPEDNYMLAVKVDGVPIPTSGMCSGYPWIYSCMFYVRVISLILGFQYNCGLLFYFIPYTCDCIVVIIVVHSQTRWYNTPSIQYITPRSGLPGAIFSYAVLYL